MSKYLARAILLAFVLAGITCLAIFDKWFLIGFAAVVVGTAVLLGLGLGLMWLIERAFPDLFSD